MSDTFGDFMIEEATKRGEELRAAQRSRDAAITERDRLRKALEDICALPTFSLSQGIVIDVNPDRLFKADAVLRIARSALSAGEDS